MKWFNGMFILYSWINNNQMHQLECIFSVCKAIVCCEFIMNTISTQILPWVNTIFTIYPYKYLKPGLNSSGNSFMLQQYVCMSLPRGSDSSKWAKTVNICIIEANVKKNRSMWHCYHSVMHLHKSDSRNRFSHRKEINSTWNVTQPTQLHVSSLLVLVLLLWA